MTMRVEQLKDLADLLSIDPGYLCRLRKKEWFPQRQADGKWDSDEVRAAIEANVRQHRKSHDYEKDQVAQKVDVNDPLIKILLAGNASPLEISRAAVQLAARTYGQGLSGGCVAARALDELKRALEELRRAEEDYLSLEIRRGLLIPRDVAKAVAGGLAGRLIGVLNNVESILGTQVEIWIGDVGFRDLTTEKRRRQVQEWFAAQARSLRELEANAIEAMVATEVAEQQNVDS
jgi:hypothetical protein